MFEIMRFHILTWVEKVGGIEEAQVKTIPSFMTAIIIFFFFFFLALRILQIHKRSKSFREIVSVTRI